MLHVQLAVLDPAHDEVDHRLVVLGPDVLVALRVLEGLLHVHPLERLDEVERVLPRLPSALLDRLLDEEDALPDGPVVAAGDDPVAPLLPAVDRVHAQQFAHLPVVRGVLVLEHPRVVLEQVDALGRAGQVLGGDRLVRADDRVAVHPLVEAHRLALGVEGDRLGPEEDRVELLGVRRHLGEVREEVLRVERDGDRLVDLRAELVEDLLVLVVVAPPPSVVREDEGPDLAEVGVGPRGAGRRLRVGVAADPEDVAVALLAGHLLGHRLRDVDRPELAGDRHGGEADARVDGPDDEVGLAALHQRAELPRAGRRVRLGVLGNVPHLATGDAAVGVDVVDRDPGRLVAPVAPGGEAAREVHLVPDDDRFAGGPGGEEVLRDGEAGALRGDAAGNGTCEERPTRGGHGFPLLEAPGSRRLPRARPPGSGERSRDAPGGPGPLPDSR